MDYTGTSWETSYKNAKRLFCNAQGFTDFNAKSRQLKQAWNAAFCLPYDYPGRDELLRGVENYSLGCGIDLDEISGY